VIITELLQAANASDDINTAYCLKTREAIVLGPETPQIQNVQFGKKHYHPGATKTPAWAHLYDALLKACIVEGHKPWDVECAQYPVIPSLMEGTFLERQQLKTILILRDPRSVAISYDKYFEEDLLRSKNLAPFIRKTQEHAACISYRYHWHRQVLGDLGIETLTIFYEHLLADSVNQYMRFAEFLHLHLEQASVEQIVTKTSASQMRRQEAKGELPGPNREGIRAKVREAEAAGFRGELKPRDLCSINQIMEPVLHPELLKVWFNVDDVASLQLTCADL
jgi:hypothetical protein